MLKAREAISDSVVFDDKERIQRHFERKKKCHKRLRCSKIAPSSSFVTFQAERPNTTFSDKIWDFFGNASDCSSGLIMTKCMELSCKIFSDNTSRQG